MAEVTSTQQEIDEQRRRALEDMAQLGYRTDLQNARQGEALNSQAAANAAYSQQAAADINAPEALRNSMAAQNTYTQGQGAGALNDSRYRDQAYRSATQGENELYFDRLSGLVPLYQQAAAAAAAARAGSGGGGGGGGGGSTNQGGFLNQGQSADEIQKAGLALADQERGRRKTSALQSFAKAQNNLNVANAAQRQRKSVDSTVRRSETARRAGMNDVNQGGARARDVAKLPSRTVRNTFRDIGRNLTTAAPMGPAVGGYLTATADAAQYNDAIEANWPFANDRIALAQEQLAATGYPVDPLAAQAAFAESYFRPIAPQQPQSPALTDVIRSTPEYQEGSSLIQQAAMQGYSSQYVQQQLNQLGYPAEVLSQLITDQFNILPYDPDYQQEFPE
jgi:hypothetical protein